MQIPVILNEADGSRSEPSAKSKDPLPVCITTNSARNFCQTLALETGNWALGTGD
jgi:hypothetical protein